MFAAVRKPQLNLRFLTRNLYAFVLIRQNPSPSNYEAKLLTGLAINQTNLGYSQIYPRNVSE